MEITNKYGLPQSFLDFARNDKYSKGQADISVTTLIDSPRVRLMREHFADLREVDVTDMIWPLFGTAVHHVLESSEPSDDIVLEERLFTKINGWILSGAVDHQKIDRNTVEITDYKVTSVWSVIHGKIDWERQLNVYAYLVQKNKGLRVSKLSICAVLRDWNKRDAANKPDYPQAPVVIVDIPMWDEKDRIDYIHKRIWLHQDAQVRYDLEIVEQDRFVPCADDERWKKEDSWAVKKKGNKRALRVFDQEVLAEGYVNSHNSLGNDGTVLEIEHRPGEYTRCKGNYCGVADFCHQYRGDN
jgi:hypothetical protein